MVRKSQRIILYYASSYAYFDNHLTHLTLKNYFAMKKILIVATNMADHINELEINSGVILVLWL